MPSSRPCSRTCGTDPPIDGSGRRSSNGSWIDHGSPSCRGPSSTSTAGRPGGLLANGLAFAALFAAFPIALVTLGVAGWLVDDPTVQAQLARAIGALLPPLQDIVNQALLALSDGAAVTSVVGLVGLVWTVSQFYVTLDIAFARVFADRRGARRLPADGPGVGRRSPGSLVIVVALIVGGSLAAAAEAFLPELVVGARGLGRVLASLPVVTALGVGRDRHRLPGRAAAGTVVARGLAAGARGRRSRSWPSASCSCSWRRG